MPFVVIARPSLMAHAQTPHVVRARAERVALLDGPHEVSRWNVVSYV